jgi:CheY-like chemotaxis protein
MLRHVGYDVVATGRPEDAVELARGELAFDLVVTDIVMPGLNGREVADAVEQVRPGTPVLFISGYAGGGDTREGGLRETDRFLAKPFTIDQLSTAVGELLGQRSGAER